MATRRPSGNDRREGRREDRLLGRVHGHPVVAENAADARIGVRIERAVREVDAAARRVIDDLLEPGQLVGGAEFGDPYGGDVFLDEIAPMLIPNRGELLE